jgi:hypothetical protein
LAGTLAEHATGCAEGRFLPSARRLALQETTMSNTLGQPADRLALLREYHRKTLQLCLWASSSSSLIREEPPDWNRIGEHFAKQPPLSEWLTANSELLQAFEEPHAQAVEWLQMGWPSWHAAMVSTFSYDLHFDRPQLQVWLGTEQDEARELVITAGRLDWRQPEFQVKLTDGNESRLCRSREVAWKRIRHAAGIERLTEQSFTESLSVEHTMLSRGWGLLASVQPWLHLAHLRSEFAAVMRGQRAPTVSRVASDGDPQQPRAKLMDAAGLTEALGLPAEDEEKVAKALKRYYDKNHGCAEHIDTPRRGESPTIYRVPLVWPHLIEQLHRWTGRSS